MADMNSPSMENPPQQPEGYKEFVEGRFDDIITRPVGGNIDEYAERAFRDLVDIVQDVQDAYARQSEVPAAFLEDRGSLQHERRAMAFFGLDPYAIESALSHLEHISNLDEIIANITEYVPIVIVPPDRRSPVVAGGEKPFTDKPLIPRLKAFLSSLETNFGIDLRDPNQCHLKEGELDPGMMREESYKFVLLSTLNRIVLICDEAENATFVFDSSVLADLPDGPTHDQLMGMTKDQLRELIQNVPRVGYRLTYQGEHFVGQMAALMDAIPEATAQVVIDMEDEQLLAEDATDREADADGSIVGTVKLAEALGATRRMVRKAIAELGDSLGELEKIDTRGSVRFSVGQQAMVGQHLVENKMIVAEAPGDFTSFTEMCTVFGASPSAVQTAIDVCGEELGDLLDARRGVRRTKYYSPDQQLQILEKLIENGSVAPRARPGYAPLTQIAEANNLVNETLAGILAEPENADVVGAPTDMRFGSNTAGGYSADQQELIAVILEERGLLRKTQPGDVNAKALPARLTHHSQRQIKLARNALDGTSGFGTWSLAITGGGRARARIYTAEQVDILEAWLNANYPEGKGK